MGHGMEVQVYHRLVVKPELAALFYELLWEQENLRYKDALKELEDLCEEGISPEDLDELNVHPEEMEAYLLDMVYLKVITDTQYELILETLVYKRLHPREWAEKKGMPYTTARTLKHRAEIALRRFEQG